MWRTLAALVGLVSFAILFAEFSAIGLFLARGQVTRETFALALDRITGESSLAKGAAAPRTTAEPEAAPSAEEIREAEIRNALDLKTQAEELRLLRELLAAEAERLDKGRAALDAERNAFEKRLAEIRSVATGAATEQAQAILKALPASEAVGYLMAAEEPEALRLLRGLPERTIGKILQEFAAGTDDEQQRGRAMFAALSAGDPERSLTETATGTDAGGDGPSPAP